MLLVAVLWATTGETPDVGSVLAGLLGSSPVAGVLGVVIRRQWQQQDREHAERIAAEGRDRTERDAERERDLATQERLLTALLQSAQAIKEHTEQGRQTYQLLVQMEALLR